MSSKTGKDSIYEVEKITGKKVTNQKVEYKVRWKGYGEDDDSWEPEENLLHCEVVLREFNEGHERAQALVEKALKTSGIERNGRETLDSDLKRLHNSPVKSKIRTIRTERTETEEGSNGDTFVRRRLVTNETDKSSKDTKSEEEKQVKVREKGPMDTLLFIAGILLALGFYYWLHINS